MNGRSVDGTGPGEPYAGKAGSQNGAGRAVEDATPGRHRSTAARIEAALLTDILSGALTPGERLEETRLSERFGTSRTPVREALSRLAASGVIVRGTGRGMSVASYGREETAQMFEAMQEIEVVCARLASRRMTFLLRAELIAAQCACKDAAEKGERDAYLAANEAFHGVIYRATQNPYVAEMASEFRRRTGPIRARRFQTDDDLVASARSHDELLRTILSSDDQGAALGMHEHLERSYLGLLPSD